jgi:hypothetical protein
VQVSPCPEGLYLDVFVLIITHLCFYDALNRADRHTLRLVEMTFALDTGICVDDVNGVAFCDGFGWAFWQAGAARNAIFVDFHCHGKNSPL